MSVVMWKSVHGGEWHWFEKGMEGVSDTVGGGV